MTEVARARRFVARIAIQAGFPEPRVYDISVVCSEACANAIEHAPVKGQVDLTARLYPDRFEVDIEGPGEFQTPDRLGDRATRGLGLPLMAKLSDHLALFSGPRGGTLVTVTFYREGHQPEADSPLPPSLLELLQSAERLEGLLETAPSAFGILDAHWRWAYLNETGIKVSGRQKSEIIGARLDEVRPDLVEDGFLDLLQEAKRRGASLRREIYNPARDAWSDVTAFPLGDGVAYFSLPISPRKRMEIALTRSEERLKRTQEIAHLGSWELDLSSNALSWSEEVYRIFGLQPQAFPGTYESAMERIHPEDRAMVEETYWRSVQEGWESYEVEHRIVKADSGEIRWVQERCLHERGEDGRIVRSLGMILDLTERKRVEEALEERERTLRQAQERDELLLRLGDTLRPLTCPVEMRRQAAHLIGDYFQADHAFFAEDDLEADTALILPDHYRQGLESLAGRYRLSDFAETRDVLMQGGALAIEDAEASQELSPKTRENYAALGFRSFAAVPLVRNGRLIWSVQVAFSEPHRWARPDLALLQDVADRTWAVVERVRVQRDLRESEERYRSLAEDNERLYRQQLDIAQNLQLALLNIPSEIGRLRVGHLYRSATEAAWVGGDFYDVFQVKDGQIAILLGDVAGHGIEAARTATLVKDVVHAFAHQSLRPHEVLRRTNRLLVEKELPGFVTAFLGILDGETGTMRYSSAGHPEALIRRQGTDIESLNSGSAPLGVYQDANWKPHEVELAAGDFLLLYTDGVIEARREGEFFGDKRLCNLIRRKRISVERLPHLILDQVLAFSHGRLKDDVAILALSLTDLEPAAKKPFRQEKLLD